MFEKAKLLFMVLVICVVGYAAAGRMGPFHSDGTVMYLVHEGGPLNLDVEICKFKAGYRNNPPLKTSPSVMFSIYNPAERPVVREYQLLGKDLKKKYSYYWPDAPAGVWQVRSALASNCNLSIAVDTIPALKGGVMFTRSRILTEDLPRIADSYIYVAEPPKVLPVPPKSYSYRPRKLNKLHIASRGIQTELYDEQGKFITKCDVHEILGAKDDTYGNSNFLTDFGTVEKTVSTEGKTVRIFDEKGKKILDMGPDNSKVLTLENGKTYRIQLEGSDKGYMTADGFPVIFCVDGETARRIGGSVVKTGDGRVFAHDFQKRMYQWMKSLKKSDLEVEFVPMEKYRAEWLADERDMDLYPAFAYAEHLFLAQDIDPESKSFGEAHTNINNLVLLYTLDRPYNPYYGNRAIMNRIFLYFFRTWVHLAESGLMFDDPEQGPYCGGTEWTGWEGMALSPDYIAAALMEPLADRKLLDMWAAALELPVRRLGNVRLTCENQSLHWPLKCYAMYMLTKDGQYLDIVRDYLDDVANPDFSESMKTGYLMEAYGPDGTYIGISTGLLAFASMFSGDTKVLPMLRRVYDFMNHSVAREPDGTLYSCNGFAHRTLGTWLECQYGGGVGLLADRMEEAAVTFKGKPHTKAEALESFNAYAKAAPPPEDMVKWCEEAGKNVTKYSLASWIPMWYNSFFRCGKPIENAKLPIEKSDNFERNFNNNFVARRTPAYYGYFYTGNPSWRSRHMRNLKGPFPPYGTKLEGNSLYFGSPSSTWMTMQGLNLFWTPEFGTFIAAHNWSMYTQNLVRAEYGDGKLSYPHCYTGTSSIKKGQVQMTHKFGEIPCNSIRTTDFMDDGMRVSIKLVPGGKLDNAVFIEQLPFIKKPGLSLEYRSADGKAVKEGSLAKSIIATSANGGSIEIVLERPCIVRTGYESTAAMNKPELRMGLLEIVIADKADGSSDIDFNYEIRACKK